MMHAGIVVDNELWKTAVWLCTTQLASPAAQSCLGKSTSRPSL